MDSLCINTIKFLAPEIVQKAISGQIQMLWDVLLRHTFCFIEFSMLMESMFVGLQETVFAFQWSSLCLAICDASFTGFLMSMNDLKAFRQLDSKTP